MPSKTYYITWPDRLITQLIVAPGKDGRNEVVMVGRKPMFEEALAGRPFPTEEADILRLAAKLGARVKASP